MKSDAVFVFATCQAASNAWLKADVRRLQPRLKFAFSRPGLLTFKLEAPGGVPVPIASPFALVSGRSLGMAKSPEDVARLLEGLPRHAAPLRLHVFERDGREASDARDARPKRHTNELRRMSPAGDDAAEAGREPDLASGTRARAVEATLRAALPARFAADVEARDGELVLDVVVAPAAALIASGGPAVPEESSEPWFIGTHTHTPTRWCSPWPGGPRRVTPPAEAPSRAYAKIEEAIAWAGLVMKPKEVVVEIGAAPGGVAWALLQRGLEVVGVDPGAIDARVLAFVGPAGNRFRHLRMVSGALTSEQLPAHVDWLLCDMNIDPPAALRALAELVALRPREWRGLVFTLKLNDERIREALPLLLDRVAELGLGKPRALQLPSNRREVTVVALR